MFDAGIGVGCAGSNGVPFLTTSGAARHGLSHTVTATNLNTTFSLAIFAFGFLDLSPVLDLGPLASMTGCNPYTELSIVFTGTATGPGTASWTWPPVTGTVGDLICCQAYGLDLGSARSTSSVRTPPTSRWACGLQRPHWLRWRRGTRQQYQPSARARCAPPRLFVSIKNLPVTLP